MKKIMFALVAVIATMFVSCNNKTAGSDACGDSTAVAVDSISADSVLVADSLVVDSIAAE